LNGNAIHRGRRDHVGIPCAVGDLDVFEAMLFLRRLAKDMAEVLLNITTHYFESTSIPIF
jgi:hypothetical protein